MAGDDALEDDAEIGVGVDVVGLALSISEAMAPQFLPPSLSPVKNAANRDVWRRIRVGSG